MGHRRAGWAVAYCADMSTQSTSPTQSATSPTPSGSPKFAVILPAAGGSSRFGRDKLAEPLGDKTVGQRSLEAFVSRQDVAVIVVPHAKGAQPLSFMPPAEREKAMKSGKIRTCVGGSCRAHTVKLAMAEVPQEIEWVAVHDAARPLVTPELIDRVFGEAVRRGAAAPAVAVTSTVKQATGPLPARAERTLPRWRMWAMQTPQAMRRADLAHAFAVCPLSLDQVTDDVQLLEIAGREAWLVQGDERNLKITTPTDAELVTSLMAGRGGLAEAAGAKK